MADEEKQKRWRTLGKFTRIYNALIKLLDQAGSSRAIVDLQFESLKTVWCDLEDAHDAYLMKTASLDEDVAEGGYLDEPGERYANALVLYSAFLTNQDDALKKQNELKVEADRQYEEDKRKREAQESKAEEKLKVTEELKEKFRSLKLQVATDAESFKKIAVSLRDSLKDASDQVKRDEWAKLELEFQSVKEKLRQLVSADQSVDAVDSEESKTAFGEVEGTFTDFQNWVLPQLKDPTTTSGGSSSSISSAKKEAVRLPKFEGAEKSSPFLHFPTWKSQWEKMIEEYPLKWRSQVLLEHLDETAKSKFIGFETDYDEAMKRLVSFYGDRLKVVAAVQRQMGATRQIVQGDYEGLLQFSVLIENSYTRLKNIDAEHELSNSQSMVAILKKFPRDVTERWSEHLSVKTADEKLRPFPVFVEWLRSRKETWDLMVATEGKKTKKDGGGNFFGETEKKDRTCFSCGEVGHISRHCPKKSSGGGGSGAQKGDKKKERRKPKVKRFWCAYHKGDPSSSCFSDTCKELKLIDPQQRVKMLTDNNDCTHCCGDHKPADCSRKDRVCGGRKDDRGCTKSHNTHELFCVAAKVFSISVSVNNNSTSSATGVFLLIMQVRGRKKSLSASVFWDLGSTSNFVKEDYAVRAGFPGHKDELFVTTLGGVTTDLTVMTYQCCLRDVDGNLVYFEAYGMNTITNAISKIGVPRIKKMFPNLCDKDVQMLRRGDWVDVLIGVSHPSWHPERVEQARGGGDMWMYRGKFGTCLGGRYPGIEEGTKKSSDLFHVNHSYHIQTECHPAHRQPHELEFCETRVESYYQSTMVPSTIDDEMCDSDETIYRETSVLHEVVPCSEVPSSVDPLPVSIPPEHHLVAVSDSIVDPLPVSIPPEHEEESLNGVSDSIAEEFPVTVPTPEKGVLFPRVVEGVSESEERSSVAMITPSLTEIPVTTEDHPSTECFAVKSCPMFNEQKFFESQELGTVVEPRCGACQCGKCPIPGSQYSFKEQQELDLINKNLYRKEGEDRWYTEYPWRCSRDALPRNEKAALQNLYSMERVLARDPELANDFTQQIKEMVTRGAAVVLSQDDLDEWEGSYYYLPMVGVKGKKKWLRVCFDASRRQGKHPSLNDCLFKGPDAFMNDLLSVILGFRNGRVGAANDISKFHNQVHLSVQEMHMQRFLWRDMNQDAEPTTYAVPVNNFGVKPANCIATCALHRSADEFVEIYPEESQEMKDQTYVDDQLVAAKDNVHAVTKTNRLDEILAHAGMANKTWVFSGDEASQLSIGSEEKSDSESVLGLSWVPSRDVFVFNVILNFVCDKEELSIKTEIEFAAALTSLRLTRRTLLSNVARIFDPVGFLCPVILQSKLLMRESWCGPVKGWDDELPDDQVKRWVAFLSSLLRLSQVEFSRSLWPAEEVVGLPSLIVFSDGSALAFGAVAYIRWELAGGGFWTRLIMAKCKVGPKRILTIPRMELNGAVLANRIKIYLEKKTNLKFGKVFHLVDSSTILSYLQTECGRFLVFEGIRIAEIQSTNVMVDGKLLGWAWLPGDLNPADWCTKTRKVEELSSSFWLCGPQFLLLDEKEWPIKFTYKKERLEGELPIPKPVFVAMATKVSDVFDCLLARCSSWKKVVRVLARMLRWREKGAAHFELQTKEIQNARKKLILFAQKGMLKELQQAKDEGVGRYRKLAPMMDDDGLWRVGSRLRNFVPFTLDNKLPLILPPDHRVTLLIMEESHQFNHAGQDSTLNRFRALGFWTVRGGHLAKSVKKSCVPCRKVDAKENLVQPMGEFPLEVLSDPVAWGCCQLDLFGPFSCRSDVNSRSRKKTWGLVVEDINSGAVHVDIVQDYSAEAVLFSLRRFGALRGWPGTLHSDPGSQLVSASGKLVNWWKDLEGPLRRFAGTKNFQWQLSPPDSPWRQGKAERRIAIIKRLLRLSIGDTVLTPVELQTTFFEVASICNERPIGLSKPREDGTYDLITPNNLLLGRSGNVLPDDASLVSQLPVASRYRLVRHVTTAFWRKWSTNVSPGLVVRQKWHSSSRNLQDGDVVLMCEHSAVKSKYKLAVVDGVHPSADGFVRSVTLRYANVQNVNGTFKSTIVHVRRSVQRLVLLLPVEDQECSIQVDEHENFVLCKAHVKAGV